MVSEGAAKTPHKGRRRLVVLAMGGGFVVAGLFVLADQAFVGGWLAPFFGSTSGAGSTAAAGLTPYGTPSYIVYALGFGVLMAGVGLLRSMFRSSLSSYASGGSAPGAGGFSPEAMQKLMATSLERMNTMPAAAAAPAVKVKCAKCGSLEEPDAAFCHKCGAAM